MGVCLRETIIVNTISFLQQKGFVVSTYLHLNNCFDIAAKKDHKIFLLKILSNIDAFRQEQASEIRRISAMFEASVIVLGERSKTFQLSKGVVYERYGVQCVDFDTFCDLLENELPKIRYFKGKKIVEIDTEKLKDKRKKLGFTLSEMAQKVNSTPESIHRYESKGSTSVEMAKKLENALGEKLVRNLDLFKPFEPEKSLHPKTINDAFERIEKLGLRLEFFSHAPFQAYSHPSDSLYLTQSKRPRDTMKKAQELSNTKKIVGGIPVIIAKDSEKENLFDVPIIKEEELFSMTKKQNLLEMAAARQKHGRRKKT